MLVLAHADADQSRNGSLEDRWVPVHSTCVIAAVVASELTVADDTSMTEVTVALWGRIVIGDTSDALWASLVSPCLCCGSVRL